MVSFSLQSHFVAAALSIKKACLSKSGKRLRRADFSSSNLCAYLGAWVSLDSAGEESSDVGGFKLWWRQLATLSPCPLPNSERSSGARCRRRWPNGGGGSALAALPWAGGRSFIHSFLPSFLLFSLHSFIHSIFLSFMKFIHPFILACINLFIHSFHSFAYSFMKGKLVHDSLMFTPVKHMTVLGPPQHPHLGTTSGSRCGKGVACLSFMVIVTPEEAATRPWRRRRFHVKPFC